MNLPPTRALYLDDSYCIECTANILAIEDNEIILDQSCMYPGGGGQPPDIGEIELANGQRIAIETVRKDEAGHVRHVGRVGLGGVEAGPAVVRVDRERRVAIMRHHTALHVFNTVMLKQFDGWITGVSIGPEESHIDFKLEAYTPEVRTRAEEMVNEVLARNLDVKAYYISGDEFRSRPDLLRTLEAAPPVENDRVRVVEIVGFEAQACGGTHLRNTAEVGRFAIRKVDNKGRQNRRFYVVLR